MREKQEQEYEINQVMEECLGEVPPEDIVGSVTPWRRPLYQVLIGTALCSITLNFLLLNYVLPTIGVCLILIGFRALRRESPAFRLAYILSFLRCAYYFPTLILNATVWQTEFYRSDIGKVLNVINLIIIVLTLCCLRQGLIQIKAKAGLPAKCSPATALLVWYAILIILALAEYTGFLAFGMIVVYIFILRNLLHIPHDLAQTGYAMRPSPTRISEKALSFALVLFLLSGIVCGYVFGNKYPMDWTEVPTHEHQNLAATKEHLLYLGFPAEILNDLAPDDIAKMEGALRISVTYDEDLSGLVFTGVAVELPGERQTWMLIHHFAWKTNPGFSGTEALQLMPTNHYDGWWCDGGVGGRVLYDLDGITYQAPYYSLSDGHTPSPRLIQGSGIGYNLLAGFSFPKEGERHRGYLSYIVWENMKGGIIDSWCNYLHQSSFAQYPVKTATEACVNNQFSSSYGVFDAALAQIQFFPASLDIESIDRFN